MRNVIYTNFQTVLTGIALVILSGCATDIEVNFRLNGNEFPTFENKNGTRPDVNDSLHVLTVQMGDTVYLQDISTPAHKIKNRSWDLNGVSFENEQFFLLTFPEPDLYRVSLCVNDKDELCATRWVHVLPASSSSSSSNTDTIKTRVRDTTNGSKVPPRIPPPPPKNPPPPPVYILNLAKEGVWHGKPYNKDVIRLDFQNTINIQDNDKGWVGYANNVRLEDGKTKSRCLEITPAERSESWVQGEFILPQQLPPNPVFRTHIGFIETGSSSLEVRFEVSIFYGGDYHALYLQNKKYDKSLSEFDIALKHNNNRQRIEKIRIKVIGLKRGKNRLELINPRIVSR